MRFALQAVKLSVLYTIRNVQLVRTEKTKVSFNYILLRNFSLKRYTWVITVSYQLTSTIKPYTQIDTDKKVRRHQRWCRVPLSSLY
ncbi:hypothetical protein HPB48_012628 [Haemaphysalis longicornis]|uniref:Uncharacterized protein n=1 Tax=Haemaphysalis longicornis TaxID=44386 RepID=A0A9J6FZ36_HAELO|nr:hypothetical protein HPB48_012628 [Haemaphysalis longicornis]